MNTNWMVNVNTERSQQMKRKRARKQMREIPQWVRDQTAHRHLELGKEKIVRFYRLRIVDWREFEAGFHVFVKYFSFPLQQSNSHEGACLSATKYPLVTLNYWLQSKLFWVPTTAQISETCSSRSTSFQSNALFLRMYFDCIRLLKLELDNLFVLQRWTG